MFAESQRQATPSRARDTTPARACASDKGRPRPPGQSVQCCMGFTLVYLLMVYLLIPADYHVRQGITTTATATATATKNEIQHAEQATG